MPPSIWLKALSCGRERQRCKYRSTTEAEAQVKTEEVKSEEPEAVEAPATKEPEPDAVEAVEANEDKEEDKEEELNQKPIL